MDMKSLKAILFGILANGIIKERFLIQIYKVNRLHSCANPFSFKTVNFHADLADLSRKIIQ